MARGPEEFGTERLRIARSSFLLTDDDAPAAALDSIMRTTIDISEEQHVRLRQMPIRRGVRGVSPLIREALERFLDDEVPTDDALAAALAVQGALSSPDADALEVAYRQLREQWR